MPHSFFVLQRLFVRVDNVLFRIYDVRTYHAFGSAEVVREINGLEATYETVKKVSPKSTVLGSDRSQSSEHPVAR
jgi:type 2A phosphatase activator TIP41